MRDRPVSIILVSAFIPLGFIAGTLLSNQPIAELYSIDTGIGLALILVLCRLAWIDMHVYRLPDMYTLALIGSGLGWHIWQDDFVVYFLGAGLGYGFIWGLRALWFRFKGVEAIGLGDAKLLAGAGAWCGAFSLPTVLLVASGAGLVYALIMRARERIAFGPFIACGMMFAWAHGPLLN